MFFKEGGGGSIPYQSGTVKKHAHFHLCVFMGEKNLTGNVEHIFLLQVVILNIPLVDMSWQKKMIIKWLLSSWSVEYF